MRASSSLIAATMALLAATAVTAQRTSPQFSFPPPNQGIGQFGSDLFTSTGQDLSGLGQQPAINSPGPQSMLVQLGSSPQPPLLAEQPQLVAQSLPPQLPPQPQPQQLQQQQQQQPPQQQQSQPQQPRQQEQPRQAEQPTIQLSRPTLSLTSLNAPQQQQQTSSSRSSQSLGQQIAANSLPPQTSPLSASSAAAGTASLSSASASPSQAQSHHQSNRHHAQAGTGSHRSTAAASQHHASSASSGRHSQHPANIQPQATSQSANPQSQQAAIEAARKAEATAASQAASSGQSYHCPDSFGYFRHHKSCDKYWACENGTATLKLCGNGLMFDDSDPKRENCAYPFSVDCGTDRTDLEPPISTPHCPRLYGLFPDSSNCRVFYSCWNGEASKYECPPGLAYDNEQRVCVWADLVERCDQSEVSDGFVCPDPTEVDQPGHYTRHAHPTDCRKFYVCIDGVARPYGCSFGSVFNVDSLQCDEPENVSGCEKYYGDLDPKLAKKLARENAQQSGNAGSSSSTSRTSSSSQKSPDQSQ